MKGKKKGGKEGSREGGREKMKKRKNYKNIPHIPCKKKLPLLLSKGKKMQLPIYFILTS